MPDAAPRKSLARDIIISVFLASGLMTFIVTIAGQFAIDGIKQGVETQGLAEFWFPIVVTLVVVAVAGAALVLLALSLIRPKWRARIWAPIASRVWGLRPVTTQRYENEKFIMESIQGHLRDQTRESFKRAEEARSGMAKRADDAINQVRESIPNVMLTLLTQVNESKESTAQELNDLRAEVDRLKKAEISRAATPAPGVSSNRPDVVAAKPRRSPEPRWKFEDISDESGATGGLVSVRVRNLVPDSVAGAVRVENATGTYGSFEFHDAAYWTDLSGTSSGDFSGRIIGTDEQGNTHLSLSWENDKGARDLIYFSIRKRANPSPDEAPF